MFTMTLYAIGRKPMIKGKSRQGETWEDTLLRLYGETLPNGDPPRRIVYMTYHAGQVGSPTNMVITGHGGPVLGETTDEPILIETDPPQF